MLVVDGRLVIFIVVTVRHFPDGRTLLAPSRSVRQPTDTRDKMDRPPVAESGRCLVTVPVKKKSRITRAINISGNENDISEVYKYV